MSSEKPNIPNSLNEHWMPFTSNKDFKENPRLIVEAEGCLLYTSPSPRDPKTSRMPSSA